MNFDQSDEFKKDLKRLKKKWRSLPGDLTRAQLFITKLYDNETSQETIEFRRNFFATQKGAILNSINDKEIVKMRLDCDSLNGSDKLRMIFVAVRNANNIIFIELYPKNENSHQREDQQRIRKYL